jgi:hypothetical protein
MTTLTTMRQTYLKISITEEVVSCKQTDEQQATEQQQFLAAKGAYEIFLKSKANALGYTHQVRYANPMLAGQENLLLTISKQST